MRQAFAFFPRSRALLTGPSARDPQVWKNANITLKLGPTGTIHSLKII